MLDMRSQLAESRLRIVLSTSTTEILNGLEVERNRLRLRLIETHISSFPDTDIYEDTFPDTDIYEDINPYITWIVTASAARRSSSRPNVDTAQQEAERQSFAEHYGHTSASYRPSQSTGPKMPDIGTNAKALEETEVDVPEHLTCPLSLQIMTDPVYFENLPSGNKQCFESSWILDHLSRDKRHPITRESLIGKRLALNEDLKKACDEFTRRNCVGTNKRCQIK